MDMDGLEKLNFKMGGSVETSINLIAVGLREVMNRDPTARQTLQTSLQMVEGVRGVPIINEEEETVLVPISDVSMRAQDLVDNIDSLALGIREIRIGSRQQRFLAPTCSNPSISGNKATYHSNSNETKVAVYEKNRSIFIVGGMKCASCVSKIEETINDVQGVTSNSVALLTGRADVRHDGMQTDINSAICSAVEASGHPCVHICSTDTNSKTADGGRRLFRFSTPQGLYSVDCPALRALIGLPGVLEVHLLPEEAAAKTAFSLLNFLGSTSKKQRHRRGRELQVLVKEGPPPRERSAAVKVGMGESGNDEYSDVTNNVKSVGPRDILDCLESYSITTSRFLNPWVSGDIKGNGGAFNDDTDLISKFQQDDILYWKQLFLFSAVLTMPIFAISVVTNGWSSGLGSIIGGATIGDVVAFVLCTPVQIVVGMPFYISAWTGLKCRRIGMNFLVAAASTTAYVFSVGVLITKAFFWEDFPKSCTFETSAMLLTFVSLGRYLESRAKSYTMGAVTSLLRSRPRGALLAVGANADYNNSNNALEPDGILGELMCGTTAAASCRNKDQPSFSDPMAEVETRWIDASLVQVGDLVRVPPGARIPCDGKVVYGESHVNESMLTGEAIPIKKKVGDNVICGSISQLGLLHVRATRVGENSTLGQIVGLIEEAQNKKAPSQIVADRVASFFAPTILILATVTFVGWYVTLLTRNDEEWPLAGVTIDPLTFSILTSVVVAVVACPCALGLATPTAVMVGTGIAAQNGVLVKGGGLAFESARRCGAIVFDKTGTLTEGRCHVIDVWIEEHQHRNYQQPSIGEDRQMRLVTSKFHLLALACIAEQCSEHPIGRAIVNKANEEALASPECLFPGINVTDWHSLPGCGVLCAINGKVLLVGKDTWVTHQLREPVSRVAKETMEGIDKDGHTTVLVSYDGILQGLFSIGDPMRQEAVKAVNVLSEKMGLDVWLASGDGKGAALSVARVVGIPDYKVICDLLPGSKAEVIRKQDHLVETKKRNGTGNTSVCFVGDGMNDAVGLAAADAGLAIGAGEDVAIDMADIVLMNSNLMDVVLALDLSRVVMRHVEMNFVWALLYNIIAIPLAMGLFLPSLGVALSPGLAAFFMVSSSVAVVLCSLSLRLYYR